MLTREGCEKRQKRLREKLSEVGIDAVAVTDRREIYYLTGELLCNYPEFPFPAMLFVHTDGGSWLATHAEEGDALVDERVPYDWHRMYTMNPDVTALMASAIAKRISGERTVGRLGWQAESMPKLVADVLENGLAPTAWAAVDDLIGDMQKRKDPDEVDLLRKAIQGGLAAYTAAQKAVAPGVNELEVLSAGQLAARDALDENIYHGGDYACREFGGPARDRVIQKGEMYIIDGHTCYRGYWSDLCRSWVVGGEPSDYQIQVFDHIRSILDDVPNLVRPGGRGSELWATIDARIRELPDFEDVGLVHHGGHAVGIRPHEMPDLNRDREGIFEVGNVFSCEPGAYNEKMNVGVRLENTFLIKEDGVENLSEYPVEIVARR